nr:MAG TPA: hypothetical protein [Caudoviricetes sp.]DAX97221.1 MAG TPA: hypothetical protein [Caudoviricetes sp.]
MNAEGRENDEEMKCVWMTVLQRLYRPVIRTLAAGTS